jgi:uncharacterized protein with FMN-binding domain
MSKNQSQQQFDLGLMIKKLFLSSFVVITFVAYVVHQRFTNPDSALNPTATPSGIIAPLGDSSSGVVPALPTAVSQAPVTNNLGLYKDGTYNGPQVDVYYGIVEVQVNVQNGKIANVNFLQYPSDRRTSQRINNIAMPYLQQEAIQAQSARVNIISGATLTSEGFMMSLDAALKSAAFQS